MRITVVVIFLLTGAVVFGQDSTTLSFSYAHFAREMKKQENVVLIHGKVGSILRVVVDAALKSDGNIQVLQVENIEDAADQIEKIPGKITSIFFLSHGDARNGNRAFFAIGSTFLRSEEVMASSALARIAKKIQSTPGPLPSAAQVVVFACGSGGIHNGGIELLTAVAEKLHATVFGPQGFAMVNTWIFTGRATWIQQTAVTDHAPKDYSNALRNHGKWTKVYEYGLSYKIETIYNVYFDSFSRIHYTQ